MTFDEYQATCHENNELRNEPAKIDRLMFVQQWMPSVCLVLKCDERLLSDREELNKSNRWTIHGLWPSSTATPKRCGSRYTGTDIESQISDELLKDEDFRRKLEVRIE